MISFAFLLYLDLEFHKRDPCSTITLSQCNPAIRSPLSELSQQDLLFFIYLFNVRVKFMIGTIAGFHTQLFQILKMVPIGRPYII